MNIDLLFTAKGEAGLLSSENFVKKAAGAVFDPQSGSVTVEFTDMDYMELNIPVDSAFFEVLDSAPRIHIGAIKDGHIAQAYQIPLLFLDDPYRSEMRTQEIRGDNPLVAFDHFVRKCINGQPVHREDLGDEEAMGCILGDAVPSSLQFAPHLARRHAMEASPKAVPRGPAGPGGPGLGSGGGGGVQQQTGYSGQKRGSEDSE
ncbi:MAG: hypothetical protein IT559_08450 [Alphaproteobacteria bacterium]|nr:hypothetical protein [Alphaproteobacteria bacterium]